MEKKFVEHDLMEDTKEIPMMDLEEAATFIQANLKY